MQQTLSSDFKAALQRLLIEPDGMDLMVSTIGDAMTSKEVNTLLRELQTVLKKKSARIVSVAVNSGSGYWQLSNLAEKLLLELGIKNYQHCHRHDPNLIFTIEHLEKRAHQLPCKPVIKKLEVCSGQNYFLDQCGGRPEWLDVIDEGYELPDVPELNPNAMEIFIKFCKDQKIYDAGA